MNFLKKIYRKIFPKPKKCKYCQLYDPRKGQCKVAMLYQGKQIHMPVFPDDDCHILDLGIEVDSIKWWVEDHNGNRTDNGIVKIEYPENFFKEPNILGDENNGL